jgi:hydroxyethylthiazole kinase-like sugar kinase family protein
MADITVVEAGAALERVRRGALVVPCIANHVAMNSAAIASGGAPAMVHAAASGICAATDPEAAARALRGAVEAARAGAPAHPAPSDEVRS